MKLYPYATNKEKSSKILKKVKFYIEWNVSISHAGKGLIIICYFFDEIKIYFSFTVRQKDKNVLSNYQNDTIV